MGLRKSWLAVGLALGVVGWFLVDGPSQVSNPQPSGQPAQLTSPIFTPAHRSVRDAVRDFFSRKPAPVQPVAYPHKVHLANNMQCVDCHASADKGPIASIPGVQLCMTCHQVIDTDKPEIKKVAAYLARGEEIPWQRVYDYSPSAHVRFNHAPHVRAGVECKACHGDMTRQTVAMRVVNLTMGYCIQCHKQKQASIECIACHY